MARVFVTRRLPGDALDRLVEAGHSVEVWPEQMPPSADELRAGAAGVAGLLSTLADRVDEGLLEHAPQLQVVANYAVGFDNIDLDACRQHGVRVGNTPDVLSDATADLAFALLLSAARQVVAAQASVRAGLWRTWEPGGFLGADLNGRTLVIVGGRGRIGTAMGDRARGFGLRVIDVGRDDDLLAALSEADFVSLHAPLTDKTRHMIDAAAIAAMPNHAILVNTARGQLVDQEALCDALEQGGLAAAALDVTDPEPLPAGHRLLDAPNLLVVPHIGSSTTATRTRMTEICVENLLAGLAGKPLPYPLV